MIKEGNRAEKEKT